MRAALRALAAVLLVPLLGAALSLPGTEAGGASTPPTVASAVVRADVPHTALNPDFDGYLANTAFNGPVYNAWGTFNNAGGNQATWIAMQASTSNSTGFFQAGAIQGGRCYTAYQNASDVIVSAWAPGPHPGDCAVGHSIEIVLYASSGSGALALFDDQTTGDEWEVTGIPVVAGADYDASFIVETNTEIGPPPSPFPTITWSGANTELDNYIFGSGAVNHPLHDYAAFGLATEFDQIPGTAVSGVSSSSSFSVT